MIGPLFAFAALALGAALRLDAADTSHDVRLSDSMSLDEIGAAMAAYPPSWESADARAKIMKSLDRLVTVRVRDGLSEEEKSKLHTLADFYRKRIDAGLDKLEATVASPSGLLAESAQRRKLLRPGDARPVTEGVHVFKFYSSSIIVKSAKGTVAFDFCQGPVNNGGEPEDCDRRGTGFYLRPDQRDRLAKLVDVYLITHRHHDHSDYSLAKRMAAKHKPVVGPAQLKLLWKDLADGITVPKFGTVQTIGPCRIFTLLGAQYSINKPGPDGQRIGVPNQAKPEADTETVCYLVEIGGVVFLAAAENHVPADAWLQKGIALGFKPNVTLSVGQFQGQRSVDALLKGLKPCFRLPVHEYEMTHEGGGNRTGQLLEGANRERFNKRTMMPLLWGEDFALTPGLLSFTNAAGDGP